MSLNRICKLDNLFEKGKKYELLYNAKQDGWGYSEATSRVFNVAPTLTVIRTKGGTILGGYTDIQFKVTPVETKLKNNFNSFNFYFTRGKEQDLKKLAHTEDSDIEIVNRPEFKQERLVIYASKKEEKHVFFPKDSAIQHQIRVTDLIGPSSDKMMTTEIK